MGTFFAEKVKISKALFSNTKYLNVAINKFSALQSVGNGKIAPNFDMIDLNGKKMDLAVLKGKAVFINVWSFGCSSSVDELKSLNKLADGFTMNEKIIFLNVFLDNDSNELLKCISQAPIKGTNVILSSNNNDLFHKKHFINTLPRYILIDKSERIINPFAGRPSSPSIMKRLNEII